ncbi:MAG: CDP-glucose 4,6-dehydratase [Flavobacteriaceae bacterium]|nr:MAG: CDP-glucose 4,6-dehydratase [Flavobacteriaceae bacterium]
MMVNDIKFWLGKKVLLTGHTGFKGSWLSIWLQHLGASLTGYSLDPPTNPSLFELAKVGDGMRDIRGDIRNLDSLTKALLESQAEIVIHMAAQPLVRHSYKFPIETYSTNVMGTVNLFEGIRASEKVKAIINVTTDKCYENREWLWGYREIDRIGGHDPYSNSKACSELVTDSYRRSYFDKENYASHGVSLASARAGNVIGGGDWSVDRLVPDCMTALLNGNKITIRNPKAVRPWQHVLEPLGGYLLLAEHLYNDGPQYAEAWNFGPLEADAIPVELLVEKICSKWGSNASFQSDDSYQPHEANHLKLDCTKSHKRLGWLPRWNLDKAIDFVIEWTKSYQNGQSIRESCQKQIDDYLDTKQVN